MVTRRNGHVRLSRRAIPGFWSVLVGGLAFASLSREVVTAADIEKANNTDPLALDTSWTGDVAPSATDVALWNATVPAAGAWTLGGDLAWGGVKVTDPGGLVAVGNTTDAFTLTLGDAAIDLGSATQNLLINSNLAVSGSQAWQVAAGRTLQLQTINTSSTLVGSGTITVSNTTGSGVATFDFRPGTRGSVSFDPQAGFSGYTGDWVIQPNTVVKTLRNGINAWGSGTIYLAGGSVGQHQNFNGAWTNTIELVAGTSSVIDDYNTSGVRALQLNGVIQGSGNLTFQETNPNVTMNPNTGYVLAAENTMSGTVTVAENAFLRVGGLGGNTNQITGGVPAAGPFGSLGTAAVTVNGGLAFTRIDAIAVPNPISGAGSVYVGSQNANLADTQFQDVTLSAVNTYAGGTQLLAGTLRINGLTSIGSGPVAIKGGSTLYYNGTGSETTARNLLMDSGAATIVMTEPTADLVWNDSATKNQIFTKDGPGSLTLGGPITGTASVTVLGGSLGLGSAASNYSGGTILNAGTLSFASLGSGSVFVNSGTLRWWPGSAQDISGQLTIADGINLTLDTNGNDVTFATGIGNFGSSSLTKAGGGTLTLGGFNSYTGATEITGGTLALASGGSIQSATVTVGSGGSLGGDGNAPAVTVLNGGGLAPGAGGAGTLTVASLTFGSTTGDRGTVLLGPNGTGGVASSVTVSGPLATNGGTGSVTFDFGAGLAQIATGTYPLINYSGAQLANVSAFTYAGTTGARQSVQLANEPQAVALVVANAFPIWSGANGSGWSTSNNWTLNTTSAPTSFLPGDTVVFNDAAVTGTVTLSQNVAPSTTNFSGNTLAYTLSGGGFEITSGSLVKSGTATVTLATANSYEGGTSVSGGTLLLGAATAIGTGPLSINGGRLASSSATALTLANAATIGGSAALGGSGSGGLTFSGPVGLAAGVRQLDVGSPVTLAGVVGNGGLVKTGAATLTLAAENVYAGGTTIVAGTLVAAANGALGTGGTVFLNTGETTGDTALLVDAPAGGVTIARGITVAPSPGTTTLGTTAFRAAGVVNFGNAVDLQAEDILLVGADGGSTQFSGGITGTGNVTASTSGTGVVVLSSIESSFFGDVAVAGGSRLQLGDGTATPASLVPDAANVTINAGASLRMAKGGGSETINSLVGSGDVVAVSGADTLVIGSAGGGGTLSGSIREDGGTLGLTKQGDGTQTFSGMNSYTRATRITAGTIEFTGNNSLGANVVNTVDTPSTVVNFGANILTIGVPNQNSTGFYYGKLEGSGKVQMAGGPATIVNADGTGGTSNNFQIFFNTDLQPLSTAPFALDTGASELNRKDFSVVDDIDNPLRLTSLSGYGAIRNDVGGVVGELVSRQIIVDQSTDTVFNGALVSHLGTGGQIRGVTFTKAGSGSLTLAGFVGKQTVAAGTGDAPVNLTVAGGVLDVTNPANTTAANPNAINIGAVTVTAGTLGFAANALLNTEGTAGATSILMDGGRLRWNAGNSQDLSAGGRLTLVEGKTASFDTNGNNVTLATAFAGGAVNASLTKLGGGVLALSAGTDYTGPTSVQAGTLQVNGASLGAGAVTVAGGATLGGTGTVGGATTLLTGATIAPGASPGTLGFAAGLTWNAGSSYNWQIADATGTAGTGWDTLSIAGGLAINATSADPFELNLWSLSGTDPDVSGDAANFSPTQGYTWTIATAAGGITGFASNAVVINTAAVNGTVGFSNPIGGGSFGLALAGNDLNLVFTPGAAPADIVIDVPSGSQTQAQAGYPTIAAADAVTKIGAGTVVFDAANAYAGPTTISAGTLQVANAGAVAASNVTVDTGATLAIASGTTMRSPAVIVDGGTLSAAAVAVNNTTGITSLAINAGTLSGSPVVTITTGGQMSLVQNARVAVAVGGLSVDQAGGGGRLDLGAGQVSIAAGGISAADLRADIIAGRNGGAWNGAAGITSSTAASSGGTRAVGYVVAGDGSSRVSFAAPGDVDLSGAVNVFDLVSINSSGRYGTGGASVWNQGDFNYDGVTNVFDLVGVNTAGAYGQGNYFPAAPSATGFGSVAAVPEPGAMALVASAAAAAGLVRWRRRN